MRLKVIEFSQVSVCGGGVTGMCVCVCVCANICLCERGVSGCVLEVGIVGKKAV